MVDLKIQKLESDLRVRISRFVTDNSKWCLSRYNALQRIREFGQYAFLCGGAVRDILLSNSRYPTIPRDLDIILGYADIKNVADSFSDCTKRWNCYGGVSIQVKDWSIDIWPLYKTWAFENKYVEGRGFSDFPKTTFLNIEAVAIQLFCKKGKKREIYSKGFFEALLNKNIEINLSENPNPYTCVVRSLSVARKFGFAIGPKLARYITHYAHQIELEKLLELYQTRYKSTRLSINELHSCIKAIEEQLRISAKDPVKLPLQDYKNHLQTSSWSKLLQISSQNLFAAQHANYT
ncbi:MAG: hypothetical protein JW947_04015 [Sedimentisphaerales bacterium]|nr:hypothetical protein [Sedimentisphaerales bacterium]